MNNKYLISILLLLTCLNYSFSQDTDGDGVNDDVDNCPQIANSSSFKTLITGDIGAHSVKVDSLGFIYVADRSFSRVLKYNSTGTEYTVVAGGNGQGSGADQLDNHEGIVSMPLEIFTLQIFLIIVFKNGFLEQLQE